MPPKRRRIMRNVSIAPKRQGVASRQRNSPNDAQPHQRIWLDLLPLEVNTRIVAAVAKGMRSEDALHLAQASPAQRKAISTALSHEYSLDRSSVGDHPLEWMSVFMSDIRKVKIACQLKTLSSEGKRTALSLLSAPTLRIARVFLRVGDLSVLLRTIAKATGLEELELWLFADGPRAMHNTRLLLQTLGTLQLRKLTLRCCASPESECPLSRIERMSDMSNNRYAFERCCPNLSAIGAHCSTHSSDFVLWTTLPSIREVTLTGDPPNCVIPLLRTLQSVRIMGLRDGVSLARRIGSSVSHLRSVDRPTTAAEITALSECERMSEMELLVKEGSESALLKTVCAMPGLSHLRLNWLPQWGQVMVPSICLSNGRSTHDLRVPHNREATAGVMLRVVQQAHALTHLEIPGVRIRLTEIVAILKHLGSRLRHFGVSFLGQHESSVDRFKVIVETIMEHNRGLRSVSAGEEPRTEFLDTSWIEDCDLNEKQALQRKNAKKMLRVLRRRLKLCVPSLNEEGVESWIGTVQWFDGDVCPSQARSAEWDRHNAVVRR